jgi:hypothetical protein
MGMGMGTGMGTIRTIRMCAICSGDLRFALDVNLSSPIYLVNIADVLVDIHLPAPVPTEARRGQSLEPQYVAGEGQTPEPK